MRDDDTLGADEFRAAQLAAMPRWYSPLGHLAGTLTVGASATIISFHHLSHVRWFEWVTIPLALLFANFFEWWAHKNVLHRPKWPFRDLYEKHTPLHHRIYRWKSMAIRDRRELRFVLIPASGVLGIVLTSSPIALAIGWLLGPNVGWLALFAFALYVTGYEMSHLAYHLPKGHPARCIPFIDRLAEHHARHHDPALMAKWNFNVTMPLADKVLGTMAPKAVLVERLEALSKRRRE
jgi:hypothetical protein